jgi:hypothetical protein
MSRRLSAVVNGTDQASPQSWLWSFLGAALTKMIHLAMIGLIVQSACFASSALRPPHHHPHRENPPLTRVPYAKCSKPFPALNRAFFLN